MYNETIKYYSKNPFNKEKLEDYDVKYNEESRACWDALVVYLKIKDKKIENWSFTWDTSMITTACASVFWESIIWKEIKKILKFDYNYIEELVWMEISKKRKESAILWLLTTRNAINLYLKNWKKDKVEDLLN